MKVGDLAELANLDGHIVRWVPATVVKVEGDDYIVFETTDRRQPAYGYDDEGRAWRRGTYVTCPLCKGCGQVLAPSEKA